MQAYLGSTGKQLFILIIPFPGGKESSPFLHGYFILADTEKVLSIIYLGWYVRIGLHISDFLVRYAGILSNWQIYSVVSGSLKYSTLSLVIITTAGLGRMNCMD